MATIAAETEEVGVTLKEGQETKNSTSKNSNTYGQEKKELSNTLPQLGNMLTSVVIMLLGIAVLVIFIGTINLKHVYQI